MAAQVDFEHAVKALYLAPRLALMLKELAHRIKNTLAKPKKSASAKPARRDEKSEREATAKYAKEERQREKQRAEAEAAKARKKRDAAIEKAQAALLRAEAEQEEKAGALAKDLEAAQRRAEAEEERWHKLKRRLEEDVRAAKD
jgi:hypothetical protein